MNKPLTASILAFATLLTTCGGAGPAATGAPSGGATGAADPCGIPVKGKCPTEASALTGAGATFPAPIYTKWVDEYNKLTGIQINYQAVGSGGGIKSLTDKTVDYGATDGPMSDQQLTDAKAPVLHIPMVMGGVVPTYNIPGVTAPLKFTPDVLAGIFLGQITKWSDAKIAAQNAGVTLPDTAITTVHRSDSSGTTYVWTDYLSKVSAEWKSKAGFANAVNWPGGLGASGNAGVAGAVKNTPGAIGYVELIYAIQNKLGYGSVQNAKGKFVEAFHEVACEGCHDVQRGSESARLRPFAGAELEDPVEDVERLPHLLGVRVRPEVDGAAPVALPAVVYVYATSA